MWISPLENDFKIFVLIVLIRVWDRFIKILHFILICPRFVIAPDSYPNMIILTYSYAFLIVAEGFKIVIISHLVMVTAYYECSYQCCCSDYMWRVPPRILGFGTQDPST